MLYPIKKILITMTKEILNSTFLKVMEKLKKAVNIISTRIKNFYEKDIPAEVTYSRKDDLLRNDDFLQQSTFWVKSVSWALIGTTGFGIAWLVLARTEEIVVAKGKLEPIGEVKEIYLPTATVVKEI